METLKQLAVVLAAMGKFQPSRKQRESDELESRLLSDRIEKHRAARPECYDLATGEYDPFRIFDAPISLRS